MNKKQLIFKCYKLINAIPFLNKKKGHVKVVNNGSILRNCKIVSTGENNTIILAPGGYYTDCNFLMYGSNGIIKLGSDCRGNNAEFYIEDKDGAIEVGNKTLFCGKIHLAVIEGRKIKIGNDCLFSSEITFRTGDSHSLLDMDGNRINPSKDIEIKDHVWVGHKVSVNKGVVIEENSMIGTGAIVTKSPAKGNVVIAGVPAKVVKENVNWDVNRI